MMPMLTTSDSKTRSPLRATATPFFGHNRLPLAA
jgi:hypothetical protein